MFGHSAVSVLPYSLEVHVQGCRMFEYVELNEVGLHIYRFGKSGLTDLEMM
jgi:hypothetical protein